MLSAVCHRGRGGWDGFLRRDGADAAAAAAPAAVEERSGGGGAGEAGCGRWSRRRTGRLRGAAAAAAAGREERGVGSSVSGEDAGLVAAAAREGDAMGGGGGWGSGWSRGGNPKAEAKAREIWGKRAGRGGDEGAHAPN